MQLTFASPNAIYWIVGVAAALLIISVATYARHLKRPIGWLPLTLRLVAIGLLLLCFAEPQLSREVPQIGANYIAILADTSFSQQLGLADSTRPWKNVNLENDSDWQRSLGSSFQLRRYSFDERMRGVDSLTNLRFDGRSSQLLSSLQRLNRNYRDRPLAGIVVLSDGQATDVREDLSEIDEPSVPIYVVDPQGLARDRDLAIGTPTSRQSNFETSPITLAVPLISRNLQGNQVRLTATDNAGSELAQSLVKIDSDDWSKSVELKFRPETIGTLACSLTAYIESEIVDGNVTESQEITLENNQRSVVVPRSRGPYRVLYVAGRPNWEHKFLQRALKADAEIEMVSLIRIAKAQPKFSFRDQSVGDSNTFFEGFEDVDEEDKERYDEPVIIRLGVRDDQQLSDGFPTDAAELFRYDCLIIDDLESEFFSQNQQTLIRQFVASRGGGLLQLAGQESFQGRRFQQSSLGELSPLRVLSNRLLDKQLSSEQPITLSREGWLEPFMRLAPNENEQQEILASIPPLGIGHTNLRPKAGARTFAESAEESDNPTPILLSQRFGKGKSMAFLADDYWRWAMSADMDNGDNGDGGLSGQLWRQWIRELISDVPKRMEISVAPSPTNPALRVISAQVLGSDFRDDPNAKVLAQIQLPAGSTQELELRPSFDSPGTYSSEFACDETGNYLVTATTTVTGELEPLMADSGWSYQPMARELASLGPNTQLLEQLATASGGSVITASELDALVDRLNIDKIPIRTLRSTTIWDRWWFLASAIALLGGEWFFRRRMGLR